MARERNGVDVQNAARPWCTCGERGPSPPCHAHRPHESSRNGRAGAPHASSRVTPQGPEGGVGHLQHCVEKRRENSCLVAFAKAPKALRSFRRAQL